MSFATKSRSQQRTPGGLGVSDRRATSPSKKNPEIKKISDLLRTMGLTLENLKKQHKTVSSIQIIPPPTTQQISQPTTREISERVESDLDLAMKEVERGQECRAELSKNLDLFNPDRSEGTVPIISGGGNNCGSNHGRSSNSSTPYSTPRDTSNIDGNILYGSGSYYGETSGTMTMGSGETSGGELERTVIAERELKRGLYKKLNAQYIELKNPMEKISKEIIELVAQKREQIRVTNRGRSQSRERADQNLNPTSGGRDPNPPSGNRSNDRSNERFNDRTPRRGDLNFSTTLDLTPGSVSSVTTVNTTSTIGSGIVAGSSSFQGGNSNFQSNLQNLNGQQQMVVVNGNRIEYSDLDQMDAHQMDAQKEEQELADLQREAGRGKQEMRQQNADLLTAEEIMAHELIAERDQELKDVRRDMATIQSLFSELHVKVIEGGEVLQVVSDNIESAQDNTHTANNELEEMLKSQERKTRCLICLMVLTFICLLFIIYFFYDLIWKKSTFIDLLHSYIVKPLSIATTSTGDTTITSGTSITSGTTITSGTSISGNMIGGSVVGVLSKVLYIGRNTSDDKVVMRGIPPPKNRSTARVDTSQPDTSHKRVNYDSDEIVFS